MDFIERLENLAKKIPLVATSLTTEEATKNALVMPFLHTVLGYDVFNPEEVLPEYTADVGQKKGEKVDYALLKDGEVQILIECKKYGEALKSKHIGQLFRYFSVTKARLAILTNGTVYQFYTDLETPNRMDDKPFLVLNLEKIDEHLVAEIKKLTKSSFDVASVVDAAGDLKYLGLVKQILADQFREPEEDFVKFFAARSYEGVLTPKVKAHFTSITSKALKQFLNDQLNERLTKAIDSGETDTPTPEDAEIENTTNGETKVFTTQDELDGYNIVKAILREKVSVKRITGRDTQSYFGVLLDNNNRKPLCRLYFNTNQNYLRTIDENKQVTRHSLESVDDIFNHSEALLRAVDFYET